MKKSTIILVLAVVFTVGMPAMAFDFSPAEADSAVAMVEQIETGDYDIELVRDAIQYYITYLQTLNGNDDPIASAEWALEHRHLFDILVVGAVTSKDSLARMSCLTLWIEYGKVLEAGFKAK
ncbi:hypothetical protein KKG41_01940 [Patescibacteria group bacterium]|nr:hypothetical protein [Patescibacteria group bacterium]MBU1890410.1 hypothetical protein [Patescibacteria group bacterium]